MVSLEAVAAFVAAGAVTWIVIPMVVRVAVSKRLLDFPDGIRHSHPNPVPRLGGVAIFAGLLVAALVAKGVQVAVGKPGLPNPEHAVTLALACVIVFLLGFLDDIRGVSPWGKVIGQTAAALLVCYGGFQIDRLIIVPDASFSIGWLGIPVTIVWVVGMSNAFNLIDGADGLAGGVAAVGLIATAITAAVLHSPTVEWEATALLGALAAFLRFNFAGKIFLGDSGSLLIGFLLAILTVTGATRGDGAVYAIAPIFTLSYPLLDTGFAMLRRWLRGTPFSRADGRHIHHQLQALGLTSRRAVFAIYLYAITVAILGLSVTFAPPRLTLIIMAAGGALLIFTLIVGARWLQYHEFAEVGASFAAAMNARGAVQQHIYARDVARLIARSRTIEEVCALVEDSATTFHFTHMQLAAPNAAFPQHLGVAPQRVARCWKLEYPIRDYLHDDVGETPRLLVLTIWGTTTGVRGPARAEQIAQIVATEVDSWLTTNASADAESWDRLTTPLRGRSVIPGSKASALG